MKAKKWSEDWKPILKGPIVRSCWTFIENLDRELYALEKKYIKESDPQMFSTGFGASLFCHYLYGVSHEKEHLKRALSFLNLALEAYGKIAVGDQLFSGLTGMAWLSEHFRMKNRLSKWATGKDPNKDLDKYLVEKIHKEALGQYSSARYGLADNWLGYGVYGLERFPNGKSRLLLESLVQMLSKKADRGEKGIAWFTNKGSIPDFYQKHFSSGYFDLGVAHGNAGVIGFLSSALKTGILPELTRDLLEGSVQWLLSHARGPYGYFSPASCEKAKKKRQPRIAWCYGDLGISAVLLNASKALKNEPLEKNALDIARRANSTSRNKSGVVEPTFCHGSMGNFHIFNRLYQSTKNIEFLKAARFWAADGMSLVKDKQVMKEVELDVVMGKTGMGLTLLSGLTRTQPLWDRFFLMS